MVVSWNGGGVKIEFDKQKIDQVSSNLEQSFRIMEDVLKAVLYTNA